VIREALAGRRVAVTGVTGFLGMGLLERLVRDIPVARIDVFIRGDARSRLDNVLAGGAFGPLRAELGERTFRERVSSLVVPHAADLTVDPVTLPVDTDLVVHCAATVSFDPPIDEAFHTNVVASLRMLEASKAAGARHVHVSTAYVAGLTRGTQPEEGLRRDVDWRAELAHAERARSDAEDASRTPEILDRLIRLARHRVGRAGPQSVAARAEELRREWVTKRLVAHGRGRARSLGWPDIYTFTKALTEAALEETREDTPLQIVRPSIIESALAHPFPGWIEGFRVAEPVILAYGRNALPDFPGIPEGVFDVIPVDIVVNAILAIAAREPEPLGFYHVSSGNRNPLPFRDMYEITREYFVREPLPERNRGAFRAPVWTFPGKRKLDVRMDTAERFISWAEKGVGRLPRGAATREAARRVDRWRGQLDFVKRYAGLYGPYTEAEVVYTDDRARALWDALPEDDRRAFNFDPTSYDWTTYLQQVHLPSITALMRWPRPARMEPRVEVAPNGASPVLAVFDVEGTVVASNVLEAYLWLRLADAPRDEWPELFASLLRRVPALLSAERRDRGEFLRSFYRRYAGTHAAEVRRLAADGMAELILRRLSPHAVRRIRQHRAAGHRVVFVTGSADFVVQPLAPLAHEIAAARLREGADGRFTGDLEVPPLVGEARASWLRAHARRLGADLSLCYAYADSMSDLPLLEAAGRPVAVNPDVTLHRIAKTRRWPVEEWEPAEGTPTILFPQPLGAMR
jgi:HAD superfamily hydrolase (TIGR01490 family)